MVEIIAPLTQIHWIDVLDVTLVGLLLWILISWSRRVHAGLALLGMAILGILYLLALQFDLQLTVWLFKGFFAVLVILLVVIFQDDLRRLFERIAVLGLRRRPGHTRTSSAAIVGHVLTKLARQRIGALVVLPGREPYERHINGGTPLDGKISEELLISIFDPNSPGHDGAVIMRGDRLSKIGVHLPLSENHEEIKESGTRHAAALGLSERADAMCVVVSEERGVISVASRGHLEIVENPDHLIGRMVQHLRLEGNERKEDKWRQVRRSLLEAISGIILALLAWLAFVPGALVEQEVRDISVTVENMPKGYRLSTVRPEKISLTLSGPRREHILATDADFTITIDALLVELGRRTFKVNSQIIRHPSTLKLIDISPQSVRLSVVKTP